MRVLFRCIRHRDDWGAIIMVDDRYAQRPKYVAGLSKWVRSSVVHFSDCNQMTNRLEEFRFGHSPNFFSWSHSKNKNQIYPWDLSFFKGIKFWRFFSYKSNLKVIDIKVTLSYMGSEPPLSHFRSCSKPLSYWQNIFGRNKQSEWPNLD